MVKANELRVGNWIYDDENMPVKVECVVSDRYKDWSDESCNVQFSVPSDSRNMYNSDVINPIPLTPEILEKAGFRLFGGIWYEIDLFEGARKLSISIGEGWAIGDSDYMSETVLLDEKMYVHQLQNIYYTITKTELEINL